MIFIALIHIYIYIYIYTHIWILKRPKFTLLYTIHIYHRHVCGESNTWTLGAVSASENRAGRRRRAVDYISILFYCLNSAETSSARGNAATCSNEIPRPRVGVPRFGSSGPSLLNTHAFSAWIWQHQ